MQFGVSSKVVAATLSLAAFAVAIVAGLAGGNDSAGVLVNALICMVVCHPVGMILGAIGERVVREHLDTALGIRPAPAADPRRTSPDKSSAGNIPNPDGSR